MFGAPNKISYATLAENVAMEPSQAFEIDPVALIAAHRRSRLGKELLIGCFHSHPNQVASPSSSDHDHADEEGWIWLILTDQALTAWRAQGNQLLPEALLID